MKRKIGYLFFLFAIIFLAVGLSNADAMGQGSVDIKGIEIDYASPDGVTLKGYLAYDASNEEVRPGVLVVHEWWGHNEYARRRARMLAEMGYTALAVDMYGDGKEALHPADAGKFAGMIRNNQELGRARFLAAMDILKGQKSVDPERIAAIGYCFGGSLVLNMARSGFELKGVASFHGGLEASKTDKPALIKARMLVAHGGADVFEPPEAVEGFKQEMRAAGVDLLFITYEGASHSFTNPDADRYAKEFNLPLGYNAKADKESWGELEKFLSSVFVD